MGVLRVTERQYGRFHGRGRKISESLVLGRSILQAQCLAQLLPVDGFPGTGGRRVNIAPCLRLIKSVTSAPEWNEVMDIGRSTDLERRQPTSRAGFDCAPVATPPLSFCGVGVPFPELVPAPAVPSTAVEGVHEVADGDRVRGSGGRAPRRGGRSFSSVVGGNASANASRLSRGSSGG